MIGVPYGPAVIKDGRYGVECPECGRVFHAEQHPRGPGDTRRDWEDEETKGAGLAYAEHYEAVHIGTVESEE